MPAIEAVYAILAEIELSMRERLKDVGVDLPHMLIATEPAGNTLVLGAMDPMLLKRVCNDLQERADQELQRKCAVTARDTSSASHDHDLQKKVLEFLEDEIKNRTEVLEGVRDAWFRFRVRGHDATAANRLAYEERVEAAKDLLALLRLDR